MSSKLSRSEIEKALRSRSQKPSNTPAQPPPPSNEPRQQRVIGGDLGGISSQQKYALLNRLLSRNYDVSVINWVLGALVLLIFLAFFWPKKPNSLKEQVDNNFAENGPSIYTESRVDDIPDQGNQNNSFSRDDDLSRATEFRKQDALEKKIRGLLQEADAQIAKNRYTLPKGDNATNTYKQILKLDKRNPSARQGLERVSDHFLKLGLEALTNNKENSASNSLRKLAFIDKGSIQHFELNSAIEQWRFTSNLNSLLESANQRMTEDKLISPSGDNALDFFQQVISLDNTNQTALAGISEVNDRLVERVKASVANNQFDQAREHLSSIEEVNANNPAITLLDGLIKTAEEEVIKNRKRSRNKQANKKETQVSTGKTPDKEASEQAVFDQQYLNLGLRAYDEGDYDSARSLLKPLADKGISRAQIRIAYMHFRGFGFTQNKETANSIANKALPAITKFANEGRAWAQTDLGSLYQDGLALKRNYSNSLKWYQAAAQQGYPRAQAKLGVMYARGLGVTSSRKTAIEWFQLGAEQGDIIAIDNLKSMGVQ